MHRLENVFKMQPIQTSADFSFVPHHSFILWRHVMKTCKPSFTFLTDLGNQQSWAWLQLEFDTQGVILQITITVQVLTAVKLQNTSCVYLLVHILFVFNGTSPGIVGLAFLSCIVLCFGETLGKYRMACMVLDFFSLVCRPQAGVGSRNAVGGSPSVHSSDSDSADEDGDSSDDEDSAVGGTTHNGRLSAGDAKGWEVWVMLFNIVPVFLLSCKFLKWMAKSEYL